MDDEYKQLLTVASAVIFSNMATKRIFLKNFEEKKEMIKTSVDLAEILLNEIDNRI